MLLKLKLSIIVLCSLITATFALAQSGQDSTALSKMKQSDFKAMEDVNPLTVLTKGNLKATFKGMKVTVDNSGSYRDYHEDLRYKVIEHSGSLAIQKYTPKVTCSTYMRNKEAVNLCRSDDNKLGGKTSIACVFPQDSISCKSSNGSLYELTVNGLFMGESYATCWRVPIPIVNFRTDCGYKQYPQKMYMWEAPLVVK